MPEKMNITTSMKKTKKSSVALFSIPLYLLLINLSMKMKRMRVIRLFQSVSYSNPRAGMCDARCSQLSGG
jgi:hypothetical protein